MKGTLNETLGLLRIRIVRQSLWTINMDTEYCKRNQGDVAGPVLGGSGTKIRETGVEISAVKGNWLLNLLD
jgi:hypothetical protein